MNKTRIALATAVAGIVAVVSLSGPAQNRIFVNGLATGRGTIANPVDLVVTGDSTIDGTGSAGDPLSAAEAESSVTAAAFGAAVDGDITYAVDTTLSDDVFAHDITINSGVTLNPNGYRIWATGTLTLDGYINRSGIDGTNGNPSGNGIGACVQNSGGVGVTGGTLPGQAGSPGVNGLNASTNSIFPTASAVTAGASGGVGAAGSPGSNGTVAGQGGSGGGAGGSTNAGGQPAGTGGSILQIAATSGGFDMQFAYSGRAPTTTLAQVGSGGGAGGCGGQCAGGNTPKQGGRGGGIGGYVVVFAKKIVGSGQILAKGGNGGNGGGGTACSGGAGGGGGGGGGIIVIVIGGGTFPSATVAGGTHGTGSSASVAGAAGADGGDGQAGYLIQWKAGF